MAQIIRGNPFLERLCAALGLDPAKTRRIVLDVSVSDAITVYTEQYGDEQLLDLDLPPLPTVKVRTFIAEER